MPAAFALYDDKHEGQANWACSWTPGGCPSRRSAQNPGRAARPLEGRRRVWRNPHRGRPGCFVCAHGIAGFEEARGPVESIAGSQPGNRLRDNVPLSRNGRDRTSLRDHAFGFPLRARIVELPGNPSVTRCPEKSARYAGPVVLRCAGICPPTANGAGLSLRRGIGLPFDRMRQKLADRVPQAPVAKGRELDPSDRRKGRWGTNWRRGAPTLWRAAHLRFAKPARPPWNL